MEGINIKYLLLLQIENPEDVFLSSVPYLNGRYAGFWDDDSYSSPGIIHHSSFNIFADLMKIVSPLDYIANGLHLNSKYWHSVSLHYW